jgi:predicted lipoprotein
MKKLYFLLGFIFFAVACGDDNTGTGNMPETTESFDRGEMLVFWADDIILPAYSNYIADLDVLQESTDAFYANPSLSTLNGFRDAYILAYQSWQQVSIFEIGKAEEIGLRNFTNIYPANEELIISNLESQNFNLILPSNFAAQGFPALDYLLYGIEDNEDAIIQVLSSANGMNYTEALVNRLRNLAGEVLDDWNQGYRDEFVSNDDSSATASTDKLVNDFLFYYERFLRAAKVGIPAGVFSGNIEPDRVEGLYSGNYSKQLFQAGFSAAQDFFNGISFNGGRQGTSLKQYLEFIHISNDTEVDLGVRINDQWQSAESALSGINANFRDQVNIDNSEMLRLYDELQKAVVLLKVDMLQSLNIQVDFVDADGD